MTDLQKKTGVFAVITAILYLTFFLFFDRAIDLWVHQHWAKTWVFALSRDISFMGKGSFIRLGVALCFIVAGLWGLDPQRPWSRILLYVCVTAAVAMVIGDGLKYLLGRYRPVMLFEQNLYGLHFFSGKWELNSTPSGHTIRAFSILTALSLIFRRLMPLFIFVAVLIGISRVLVTAHYPSDVLFGAYIGIFTALWTFAYFFKKDPLTASGIDARGRRHLSEK